MRNALCISSAGDQFVSAGQVGAPSGRLGDLPVRGRRWKRTCGGLTGDTYAVDDVSLELARLGAVRRRLLLLLLGTDEIHLVVVVLLLVDVENVLVVIRPKSEPRQLRRAEGGCKWEQI